MSDKHPMDRIEGSFILTCIGIALFFTAAIVVTVTAPNYVDPSWTTPLSDYQEQLYEVADPHLYISAGTPKGYDLQFVEHVKSGFTLFGFQEEAQLKILAPPNLQNYITKPGEKLKLTHRVLFLRSPQGDLLKEAEKLQKQALLEEGLKIKIQIWELYDPGVDEGFVYQSTKSGVDDWSESFTLLEEPAYSYQRAQGVVYVKNPVEFRVVFEETPTGRAFRYNPQGRAISSLEDLQSLPFGFISRKDLISMGEKIYAAEGCFYCHTDQTRTLIQDTVLNGADSYPAPASTANEYIYQRVTYPGTKRNGPDISRTGIKKPSRDWHKAHFWSPKTTSEGSIMPSFRHFFDDDPSGTSPLGMGVPNVKFEAIYQYLMTKGTRLYPPTQPWWDGKDPVQTIYLIGGEDNGK